MMTAYANAMVVDINGMKNDGFPYPVSEDDVHDNGMGLIDMTISIKC